MKQHLPAFGGNQMRAPPLFSEMLSSGPPAMRGCKQSRWSSATASGAGPQYSGSDQASIMSMITSAD